MTADLKTESRFGLLWWARHLHEMVATVTFVAAVGHLFLLRRFHPGVIFFLLPPAVAAVYWKRGELPSTRLLGGGFLLLLLIGDAIAPFHQVLPRMNSFPELPLTANRILTWYVAIYLLYMLLIIPPPVFIRPLIQRRRGQTPYFSWPTCCLGLLCWAIVGPPTLFISVCALLRIGPFKH